MKQHVVLSAVGHDRVGVADDLTAALARRRVDIEDSRWTALQGQFALIVRVGGEQADIARLQKDLSAFGADLGFRFEMGPIEVERRPGGEQKFLIESYSTGPAGVGAVTNLLKRHEINIEELETEASASSWTSRLTFHLTARITVPQSCLVDKLIDELRRLEAESDLDIVIKPEPTEVHA